MKVFVLSLWCIGLSAAEELREPKQYHTTDGPAYLNMGYAPLPDYGIDTFAYNGSIPGPTLRVKPGGSLEVHVKNSLYGGVNCDEEPEAMFCDSSDTNLHVHGLHVSPEDVMHNPGSSVGGAKKENFGDDVFSLVPSGTTGTYHAMLPPSHISGTYWYHPHAHHAVALQAGGGAGGLIIIEDPPGYLPSEYDQMPERQLFIHAMNLAVLQTSADQAESTVLTNGLASIMGTDKSPVVLLINGQSNPTTNVEAKTWYRLRFCFASVDQSMELNMTKGNGKCEMQLMAKDGVYLTTVPRSISRVYLASGNRADVAVACTCETYPCEVTMLGRAWTYADYGTVPMLTFNISAKESLISTPVLPLWTPRLPCYLADLRQAAVPSANSNDLKFIFIQSNPNAQNAEEALEALADDQHNISWNGNSETMTTEAMKALGVNMLHYPPMTNFLAGSVQEMKVTGVDAHPVHIHINHMQITDMPVNVSEATGGFYQTGDRADTILMPSVGNGNSIKVRMQIDNYTGRMVVHCHLLSHEDEGMMAFINLTGTAGSIYQEAEQLDPTCYRSFFTDLAADNPRLLKEELEDPSHWAAVPFLTSIVAIVAIIGAFFLLQRVRRQKQFDLADSDDVFSLSGV